MDKYTGLDSGATSGNCTKTAGYISNAEIDQIIDLDNDNTTQKLFDAASHVNILVWKGEDSSVNCPASCVLVLPDLPLSTSTVITRPP